MCQRVISFVNKNCDSKIPVFKNFKSIDKKLTKELVDKVKNLKDLMEDQDLNNYIKEVINLSFDANKYFNDLEPWSLKKTNKERMDTILYTILNQIRSISILLYPIIPNSSSKTLDTLCVKKDDISVNKIENTNYLKPGTKIKTSSILFKKIENDN